MALLLSGCLNDAAPGVTRPAPETLEYVVRASVQALLTKDVDYLVAHHADDFVRTADNTTLNKTQFRAMLTELFASSTWTADYGNASRPEDVWAIDHFETW